MDEEIASCTITVDHVRKAWKSWRRDPSSEPPDDLVDAVRRRAGMVEAAMLDGGVGLLQVLLLELGER